MPSANRRPALFNAELKSIGVDVPRSFACTSVAEAEKAAADIGFPVIVRAAFALGGKGVDGFECGAIVRSAQSRVRRIASGIGGGGFNRLEGKSSTKWCATGPTTALRCVTWKISIRSVFTPANRLSWHGGQTLDNYDYQMLRSIALKVIRHLGIVGECNIQYALHPKESHVSCHRSECAPRSLIGPRVQATGYPLAFVAAKLALGYTLPELKTPSPK